MTTRASSVELDAILGEKIPVLNDGFIRVIDYMGNDTAIVQAARVSYGAGTKAVSDDEALLRYLMRQKHTSPFEMCELKLHVRVPMDTWRQWIRHRTASVNEYSTRYSEAIDSVVVTNPTAWRSQAQDNKQGSGQCLDAEIGEELTRREQTLHMLARDVYKDRLSAGVAREQARKDLPLSTYTEAYWKIDLKNLLWFLQLRMDKHAQLEIRQYASVIGHEIVRVWCPMTWKAFCDYSLNSMSFSMAEQQFLAELFFGAEDNDPTETMKNLGFVRDDKLTREGAELRAKIDKIRGLLPEQP